jgi:HK97 family phage major capsid protein
VTRNERSLGEFIVESPDFKKFTERAGLDGRRLALAWNGDIRQRATATTSTITNYIGIVAAPGPIEIGVQQATVADLLSQGTTENNSVPFIVEDTITNAATTVAEGSAKPEATWDWSQTSAPVRKIAVTSKVSDELLDDVPGMRSYLDSRLRWMVEIQEDAQLISGDGTGSNLTGLMVTSGIQTQAKGADTTLDAIRKAITKVQSTGQFTPDGIILHPADWEEISLLKDANNQYYAGGPFFAPYGNGGFIAFQRLWGLPVVVTTSATQNTAVVGAFRMGAQLVRRKGLTLDFGYVNDDFKLNLLTLRCETRLALCVWRPKAICLVTGI